MDRWAILLGVVALATAPHSRNLRYLRTKEERLGHVRPSGDAVGAESDEPSRAVDVSALIGSVRPAGRPYVVLKYAQTLDGRIARAK